MSISEQISIAVNTARTFQGLTMKELSVKAKITISFISEIERGRRNPGLITIEKVSRALGTNSNSLISFGKELSRAKDSRTKAEIYSKYYWSGK